MKEKKMNFVTKIEECEIGKGWHGIVQPLLDAALQQNINILQIKQKFAGLRVYYAHAKTFLDKEGNYTKYHTDEFDKLVAIAEEQAVVTCEACGEPGKVRGGAWLFIACDKHAKRT
jgi:rubrerythrin